MVLIIVTGSILFIRYLCVCLCIIVHKLLQNILSSLNFCVIIHHGLLSCSSFLGCLLSRMLYRYVFANFATCMYMLLI